MSLEIKRYAWDPKNPICRCYNISSNGVIQLFPLTEKVYKPDWARGVIKEKEVPLALSFMLPPRMSIPNLAVHMFSSLFPNMTFSPDNKTESTYPSSIDLAKSEEINLILNYLRIQNDQTNSDKICRLIDSLNQNRIPSKMRRYLTRLSDTVLLSQQTRYQSLQSIITNKILGAIIDFSTDKNVFPVNNCSVLGAQIVSIETRVERDGKKFVVVETRYNPPVYELRGNRLLVKDDQSVKIRRVFMVDYYMNGSIGMYAIDPK